MTEEKEQMFGELPCQICGRPVTVLLPFVGCVFCSKCSITTTTGWPAEANTEYFKYPYQEE